MSTLFVVRTKQPSDNRQAHHFHCPQRPVPVAVPARTPEELPFTSHINTRTNLKQKTKPRKSENDRTAPQTIDRHFAVLILKLENPLDQKTDFPAPPAVSCIRRRAVSVRGSHLFIWFDQLFS